MQTRIIRLFLLLSCFLPGLALAETPHSIHVAWRYNPPSSPAVTGFKLYQDGVFVCQTENPTATSLDCLVSPTSDTSKFTLTTTFANGTEGRQSPSFSYSFAANSQGEHGTGSHRFSFFWDYSTTATIKGFRIYQNNALICQTNDPVARQLTCIADLATTPATYTMTAVNTDDTETDASNALIYAGDGSAAPLQAIIAADIVSGEVPLSVSFNGAASTGEVASYQWDFGDDSTATSPTATHTYTTAGTYTVKLTVVGNTGATNAATLLITASDPAVPPTPPTAVISSSAATGPMPLTVNFDGSGSTAANATITSYSWSFGDNTSGTGATASHTYTSTGTYTVTLTVTDSKGQSNSASTPVIVTSPGTSNTPPQAIIGAAPTTGPLPLAVTFNGGGSTDTDGNIVNYMWNFGDGSGTATGQSTTHTYTTAGTYTAALQVTDDQGAVGIASVSIVVNNGDHGTGSHRFSFFWDYSTTATIKGFRIYQNNALICQTNDPVARQLTCIADLATTPATYTMTAVNTDDTETDASNALIYAGDGSAAPLQAIIAADIVSGEVPLSVSFNGASSTGEVASYQWDFGDDSTATSPTATHTYTTAGTYTVKLTVVGNTGATNAATLLITASDPAVPPTPPTAVISSSAATGPMPLTVNFDGSGSTATNATITSYSWSFGDNTSGTGATASHTYTSTGTYTVTLTVTDSKGQSNSASTPVIVTPPGTSTLFYWSIDSLPQATPIVSDTGNVTISRHLNDATLAPGFKGNCMQQTGNHQYYKIPMATVPNDKGTIRLYARHDTAPSSTDSINRLFFQSTNMGVANSLYAYTYKGTIYFYIYDSTGTLHRVYGASTWQTGTWYLYEFSWDATTGSLVVKRDGAILLQATTPSWAAAIPSWTGQQLSFGSTYPIGSLDEIYIIY